jgi:hypothetical protein
MKIICKISIIFIIISFLLVHIYLYFSLDPSDPIKEPASLAIFIIFIIIFFAILLIND